MKKQARFGNLGYIYSTAFSRRRSAIIFKSMKQKKARPQRQKHIPQRTCVACRQKFDKKRLTRIVRTPENGVVIDPGGKQNGRGAYLCGQRACWEHVLQQPQLLNKALQTTVSAAEWQLIAAHKPDDNPGATA